jgi:hypothetical protein
MTFQHSAITTSTQRKANCVVNAGNTSGASSEAASRAP